MDATIKARWVAAPRSGGFQQTDGALRKNDKFCCLGVLCELAVRDGVIEPAEELPTTDWRVASEETGVYAYAGQTGHLPGEVAEWAGLMINDSFDEADYPDVSPTVSEGDLTELNDDYGWDFIRIADIIEKEL